MNPMVLARFRCRRAIVGIMAGWRGSGGGVGGRGRRNKRCAGSSLSSLSTTLAARHLDAREQHGTVVAVIGYQLHRPN
jgi:hypothetical protein